MRREELTCSDEKDEDGERGAKRRLFLNVRRAQIHIALKVHGNHTMCFKVCQVALHFRIVCVERNAMVEILNEAVYTLDALHISLSHGGSEVNTSHILEPNSVKEPGEGVCQVDIDKLI